jgi:hypothetical protein
LLGEVAMTKRESRRTWTLLALGMFVPGGILAACTSTEAPPSDAPRYDLAVAAAGWPMRNVTIDVSPANGSTAFRVVDTTDATLPRGTRRVRIERALLGSAGSAHRVAWIDGNMSMAPPERVDVLVECDGKTDRYLVSFDAASVASIETKASTFSTLQAR